MVRYISSVRCQHMDQIAGIPHFCHRKRFCNKAVVYPLHHNENSFNISVKAESANTVGLEEYWLQKH